MDEAEDLLTAEEIKEKKPNLNEAQYHLACAYAEARSWKKYDEMLSKDEISSAVSLLIYPKDLALNLLKSLDDYRMGLIVEREKNRNRNG